MTEPTWVDDEPDPTGVRILLAALPDPGPMPAQLSERILAALAEASRRAELDDDTGSAELGAELGLLGGPGLQLVDGGVRSSSGGLGTGGPGASRPGSGGPGASRPGSGRRGSTVDQRRRWTVLGSVAASVAALGLAGALLSHQSGGSSTAGARTDAVAGAALPGTQSGAKDAAPAAPGSAVAPPEFATNAAGQRLHIELSSRTYTTDTIVRAAQGMLDAPGPQLGQPAVESPSVGPIGTVVGLSECIVTLGEADAQQVYADLASFDGQPAAIVVVIDPAGLKQVYAVQRSCTKGDPALIVGPVAMP